MTEYIICDKYGQENVDKCKDAIKVLEECGFNIGHNHLYVCRMFMYESPELTFKDSVWVINASLGQAAFKIKGGWYLEHGTCYGKPIMFLHSTKNGDNSSQSDKWSHVMFCDYPVGNLWDDPKPSDDYCIF